MARFARNQCLVTALIDGVDAVLSLHPQRYDSHDLINWLNANRNDQLNDIYDLYTDCDDPEMTADQQIGKYLYTLGQIRVGETRSPRQITRRGGRPDRNGTCAASVWEASPRTRAGLAAARETLFGPGGFFERIAAEPASTAPADWLDRTTGSFADESEFEKVLEYGRAFRSGEAAIEDEGT